MKEIGKLGFDVVHGCQLRCLGCPNSTRKPKIEYVTIENFRKCLANINVKRVETFRLFVFGEPLLHPEINSLVWLARRNKWKCKNLEISTNAQINMDAVNSVRIDGLFCNSPLTHFVVSCDGDGTPESYEKLRPPAKWGKLIEFLKFCKSSKDKYKSKVKLITRTIIEKPSHAKQWKRILRPLGWEPEFRDMLKMPEGGNPFNKIYKKHSSLCSYMRKPRLYVDYNGEVIPCCAHPRAFVMGNLLEQKYTQILAGKKRAKYKWRMKHSRKSMKICGECGIP